MGYSKNLKAPPGMILVKVEMHNKENIKFASGETIVVERGYDFNLRQDKPSIGIMVDGGDAPAGSLVLIHHNSTESSYEVFNYENEKDHKLYSIPKDMVFLYRKDGEWFPFENFVISSRIFKPYKGILIGVDGSVVKNRMYIHRGLHEGNACVTLVNCDYELIFYIDGKENRIIRTRTREILGIDVELTELIKKGEYEIGLNTSEAKKLKYETTTLQKGSAARTARNSRKKKNSAS